MVIEQTKIKRAEFYTGNMCGKCGERKRYKSTQACVACVHERDAARTDDRRSHRKKCEERLRKDGVSLVGLSRQEKDDIIAAEFPDMGEYMAKKFGYVPGEKSRHTTKDT